VSPERAILEPSEADDQFSAPHTGAEVPKLHRTIVYASSCAGHSLVRLLRAFEHSGDRADRGTTH